MSSDTSRVHQTRKRRLLLAALLLLRFTLPLLAYEDTSGREKMVISHYRKVVGNERVWAQWEGSYKQYFPYIILLSHTYNSPGYILFQTREIVYNTRSINGKSAYIQLDKIFFSF